MIRALVIVFDLDERLTGGGCELGLKLGSVAGNPTTVGAHSDVESVIETSLEEVLVVTVYGTKVVAGRSRLRTHAEGMGDLEDGVDADGFG